MNRQSLFVSESSITIDIPQTGNVLGHLPAKLPAHDIVPIDYLRYPAKLILSKFAGLCVAINARLLQYLFGCVPAYTVDIGQGNPYRFVNGNINTN
jgi:hypothetical protein